MDGEVTDDLALAMTIASHQCHDGEATMKIIVSDNNFETSSRKDFLLLWDTQLNTGVGPGEFLWVPTSLDLPIASKQIFGERLATKDALEAGEATIPGTSLKVSVFRGTTVDNPAYGVGAGTQVDMFVVYPKSDITDFIDITNVDILTPKLVDLASNIATSDELGSRILAFIDGETEPCQLS